MRNMYDSEQNKDLRTDGSPVAVWLDSPVDWEALGDAPRVPIQRYVPTHDGAGDAQNTVNQVRPHVAAGGYIALSIPADDASVVAAGYAVAWTDTVRTLGFRPVIYTTRRAQQLLSAVRSDWWLIAPSDQSALVYGTVATKTGPGVSVTTDFFPSPAPTHVQDNTPSPDPTPPTVIPAGLPLYTHSGDGGINSIVWPSARVQTADDGAPLYHYIGDKTGEIATGADTDWHVYDGPVDPLE